REPHRRRRGQRRRRRAHRAARGESRGRERSAGQGEEGEGGRRGGEGGRQQEAEDCGDPATGEEVKDHDLEEEGTLLCSLWCACMLRKKRWGVTVCRAAAQMSMKHRTEAFYETEKGEMVQSLLCRWWYAMEWPRESD